MCHGKTFYRTDQETKKAPAIGFYLPCIQSKEFEIQKYDWYKTNEETIFEVVQQKPIFDETGNMQLVTIVRCPYCGELSRLDEKETIALHEYVINNENRFTPLQIDIAKTAYAGLNISEVVEG